MGLIRPFDPWKGRLCTCPPKYSLSPYTGCSHACLYCYAQTYIRKFNAPRPKVDFLRKVKKEAERLAKTSSHAYITISNSSDPYQMLEEKLGFTRSALEILSNCEFRIMVVTKSMLVVRDMELLKKMNAVVAVSITTLNEELAKILEPGASTPNERLYAVKQLSEKIPVVVRFDPLIFPLTTNEIENAVKEFKKAGASHIVTSTLKVRPQILNKLTSKFPQYKKVWEELYLKKGEKYSGYYYLPENLRRDLIEKVVSACKKADLTLTFCREGFSFAKNLKCDGSHLF